VRLPASPEIAWCICAAQEILPYEKRSPHAEISEARAVSLWRFATGEADLLIAPIQAALWRMREPDFYRRLARTIERDQDIPHAEMLSFLAGAGYEKHVTCEMPGQFAVRGGIIDVFSPGGSAAGAHRAVRRHD
jgi:transcription-repair coupling factor (superfamily II helicase)